MKKSLLIVFDAEGITNISKLQEVAKDFSSFGPTKKLTREISKDVNSALLGASLAGINNVFIIDDHYKGNNIQLKDLTIPKNMCVKLYNGDPLLLKKICKKVSFAALLGQHGKPYSNDKMPALTKEDFNNKKNTGTAHVYTFSVKDMLINNISRTEGYLYAHVLQDLNVPLIFFSGSKAAVKDILKFNNKLIVVPTRNGQKKYISSKVRQQISEKLNCAIRNNSCFYKNEELNSFSFNFFHPKKREYLIGINEEIKLFLDNAPKNKYSYKNRKITYYLKGKEKYYQIYKILCGALMNP